MTFRFVALLAVSTEEQNSPDKVSMEDQLTNAPRLWGTVGQILPYALDWIRGDDPKMVKFHLSQTMVLTAYPDGTIQGELI